jgi:hypothetical protein
MLTIIHNLRDMCYLQATTPVNVENWSYIGNDCADCVRVPPIECLLSRVGPATGPVNGNALTFGAGPAAMQMPLTSMRGNSGSCAIYSPDGCCIAISSYAVGGSCGTNCENFWSPIMSSRPLTTLWAARQRTLPGVF